MTGPKQPDNLWLGILIYYHLFFKCFKDNEWSSTVFLKRWGVGGDSHRDKMLPKKKKYFLDESDEVI